jgi:hypothetical protein
VFRARSRSNNFMRLRTARTCRARIRTERGFESRSRRRMFSALRAAVGGFEPEIRSSGSLRRPQLSALPAATLRPPARFRAISSRRSRAGARSSSPLLAGQRPSPPHFVVPNLPEDVGTLLRHQDAPKRSRRRRAQHGRPKVRIRSDSPSCVGELHREELRRPAGDSPPAACAAPPPARGWRAWSSRVRQERVH